MHWRKKVKENFPLAILLVRLRSFSITPSSASFGRSALGLSKPNLTSSDRRMRVASRSQVVGGTGSSDFMHRLSAKFHELGKNSDFPYIIISDDKQLFNDANLIIDDALWRIFASPA